jgi:hypothetical protein
MILHDHKIIWAANERTFVAAIHAQSCKGICHTLDFLDLILIPKKMIVLISLNRCGMVGVSLRELRKGGKELSMKKEYILLAIQITIEVVVVFGITPETSCNSAPFETVMAISRLQDSTL